MIQGSAMIIEDYDGKFLLHLRDEQAPLMKNEWCLVGGTIEPGESPGDTVKREMFEETNLTPTDIEFYKSFQRTDTDKEMYIFHVKVDTRKEKIVLGEGKALKLMTKGEILELIESIKEPNQFLQTLKMYLENKQ